MNITSLSSSKQPSHRSPILNTHPSLHTPLSRRGSPGLYTQPPPSLHTPHTSLVKERLPRSLYSTHPPPYTHLSQGETAQVSILNPPPSQGETAQVSIQRFSQASILNPPPPYVHTSLKERLPRSLYPRAKTLAPWRAIGVNRIIIFRNTIKHVPQRLWCSLDCHHVGGACGA